MIFVVFGNRIFFCLCQNGWKGDICDIKGLYNYDQKIYFFNDFFFFFKKSLEKKYVKSNRLINNLKVNK